MHVEGIPFIFYDTTSEGKDEVATGIRPSVFYNGHTGKFKGILISGLGSGIEGGSDSNLSGAAISGICSFIDGKLTGFSYGTLYNRAQGNGRLAIQCGTTNIIRDYNPEGTTIQVGLYNRCDNQTIPLVNIRGIKNLFKSKKKETLEEKI
jgi:hypothetical protein